MTPITPPLRRLHNILGLVVGAQMLLWVASGFFFALKPIETVRGDHLRAADHEMLAAVPEDAIDAAAALRGVGEPVMRLSLKPYLGRAVWEADTHSGYVLIDAMTGAKLSPISETDARALAIAAWAGNGKLTTVALIEKAPREAGRGEGRAMWRADFTGAQDATLWIDAQRGDVAAVRTGWWRAFDLFWGLHIMDWSGRETISSIWMKLFGFGALMLTVAGLWLVGVRLVRGTLFR